MRSPVKQALLLALAVVTGSNTQALATAAQFLSTGDLLAAYDQGDAMSRQFVLLGLAQIESGMALANAELRAKGIAPLYCAPSQLVLTGEQILDILRRYSASHPEASQGSYAVAILRAAEEVFPCR